MTDPRPPHRRTAHPAARPADEKAAELRRPADVRTAAGAVHFRPAAPVAQGGAGRGVSPRGGCTPPAWRPRAALRCPRPHGSLRSTRSAGDVRRPARCRVPAHRPHGPVSRALLLRCGRSSPGGPFRLADSLKGLAGPVCGFTLPRDTGFRGDATRPFAENRPRRRGVAVGVAAGFRARPDGWAGTCGARRGPGPGTPSATAGGRGSRNAPSRTRRSPFRFTPPAVRRRAPCGARAGPAAHGRPVPPRRSRPGRARSSAAGAAPRRRVVALAVAALGRAAPPGRGSDLAAVRSPTPMIGPAPPPVA